MELFEAMDFIGLLGTLHPPALLLSGGEPMTRDDILLLIEAAHALGISPALSTNGVLIDDASAGAVKKFVSYVGISVDGPREIHDAFRRRAGSFDDAIRGIELLAGAGCRVGLRVTLARQNIPYLGEIFALAESLPVSRICFYHFMRSGRGSLDEELAPTRSEERRAVREIVRWADGLRGVRGGSVPPFEILTAADESDNGIVLEYLAERDDGRLGPAEPAKELIRRAERRKGPGILSVRWDGLVFRNQFSWDRPLGTWRELSDIAARSERSGA
jgi:MoaA/NifB/PqqE/SkfB family radical SAM enzyme